MLSLRLVCLPSAHSSGVTLADRKASIAKMISLSVDSGASDDVHRTVSVQWDKTDQPHDCATRMSQREEPEAVAAATAVDGDANKAAENA